MWLPQGGALKIGNLQFTQYSIIINGISHTQYQSLLTANHQSQCLNRVRE